MLNSFCKGIVCSLSWLLRHATDGKALSNNLRTVRRSVTIQRATQKICFWFKLHPSKLWLVNVFRVLALWRWQWTFKQVIPKRVKKRSPRHHVCIIRNLGINPPTKIIQIHKLWTKIIHPQIPQTPFKIVNHNLLSWIWHCLWFAYCLRLGQLTWTVDSGTTIALRTQRTARTCIRTCEHCKGLSISHGTQTHCVLRKKVADYWAQGWGPKLLLI